MLNHRRNLSIGLLAALVLPWMVFTPAVAQQEPPPDPVLPGRPDQAGDPKQLGEMAGKDLAQARAAIDKKMWDEAAEALARLLDMPAGALVPVRGKADLKETTHWFSPHVQGNALVAALPPEGLAAYRKRADGPAAELLKNARAKKDASMLALTALRFQHTPAGREALTLLAEQHAATGRHLEAALCLDRLIRQTPAAKLQPKVLAQAAGAFRRAGEKGAADRLMKQLQALLKNDAALLKDLEAEVERIPITPVDGWALFRGNAARNGHAPAGAAKVKAAQWTRPVLLDKGVFGEEEKGKDGKQWLEKAVKLAEQAKRPFMAGAVPLAVGDLAVYRTHLTVTAVALKDLHDKASDLKLKPGDIFWKSVEMEGGLAALLDDVGPRQEVSGWLGLYEKGGDAGFLFENTLTGTLSADRQHVYALDDLAVPPPGLVFQPAVWNGRLGPLKPLVVQNNLQAFSVRTGKLEWQIHNRWDKEKPFNGSHWLGAPLPLGGVLYMLNEKNDGELRLVGVEAATGKVLSTQPLATVKEKFLHEPNRRTQACHLAYDDGVLLCPTNAGMLLAVDLATQTPVWAYTYRPLRGEPEPAKMRLARPFWQGSAPVLHGGRVVYAAPDDPFVHCLDVREGKPQWRVKQGDDHYVAGVVGDRVVLVGQQSCRALRLKDGGELWKLNVEEVGGLGVLGADGSLVLPVRGKAAELWTIDTAKGQVTDKQALGAPAGNLLWHGGRLVSQTATHVSAFPGAK
jgi:outer membrane protein assembly factor BamB